MERLSLFSTSTTHFKRTLGTNEGTIRLCVDKRLLPHLIAFLCQLPKQFDDEDLAQELALHLVEQAIAGLPCRWGLHLELPSRNLLAEQGEDVGLEPPWEIRQLDGMLQYRTKP